MLTAAAICKTYKKHTALAPVDLAIAPGSITLLLGRNGSGKSTMLGILALALRPDSGTVAVEGKTLAQARKLIGFVPQETALFEELTVEENMLCFCKPAADTPLLCNSIIDALDLGEKRKKVLRSLSGGQRRRASLACALASRPEYLLLDEPLAGVDTQSEGQILEVLQRCKAQGIGILVASHHPESLLSISDSVIRLEAGQVVFRGTAQQYMQEGSR